MANPFGNLNTEGMEQAQDRLGGGNFQPVDSGIYAGTIKYMYAGKAQSGARSVTVAVDLDMGEGNETKEYRETFYVTDKEGKPWFPAKDRDGKPTGKKNPLPGFTVIEDICLITCEKTLSEMDFEEKVINIYNFEAKKEEPTTVPMAVEAIGKRVALGIIKQKENKSEKDANGVYQPTAEEREINLVDKVFHPELKVTVAEARDGKEAAFWDAWEARNKGQVRDRRKIKDGQGGAPKAAPKPGGAPAANRPSLFGKKS